MIRLRPVGPLEVPGGFRSRPEALDDGPSPRVGGHRRGRDSAAMPPAGAFAAGDQSLARLAPGECLVARADPDVIGGHGRDEGDGRLDRGVQVAGRNRPAESWGFGVSPLSRRLLGLDQLSHLQGEHLAVPGRLDFGQIAAGQRQIARVLRRPMAGDPRGQNLLQACRGQLPRLDECLRPLFQAAEITGRPLLVLLIDLPIQLRPFLEDGPVGGGRRVGRPGGLRGGPPARAASTRVIRTFLFSPRFFPLTRPVALSNFDRFHSIVYGGTRGGTRHRGQAHPGAPSPGSGGGESPRGRR